MIPYLFGNVLVKRSGDAKAPSKACQNRYYIKLLFSKISKSNYSTLFKL